MVFTRKDGKPNAKRKLSLDNASIRALRRLNISFNRYKVEVERAHSLVSFRQRINKHGQIRPISVVNLRDRPEIEIYLEYRDGIFEIDKNIAFLEDHIKKLEKMSDSQGPLISAAYSDIANLRGVRLKHLVAMQSVLEVLGREFGRKEESLAKMAVEGTKMQLDMKKHEDKMSIERGKNNIDMTEIEIERIANEG